MILIFALAFIIIGFLSFMIGVELKHNGGFVSALGFFLVIAGFVLVILWGSDHRLKGHNAIYRDVRKAGWNIKSSDVHYDDDVIDVGCFKLKVHKIDDVYLVVSKHDKDYKIIPSSNQKKFREICS